MVEPKEFQDALLSYHARPADREAEAVRAAVLEQVAAMLDKKADDYAHACGRVDWETGALEFGAGPSAQVREDHYNDLRELADEVRAMKRAGGVIASVPPADALEQADAFLALLRGLFLSNAPQLAIESDRRRLFDECVRIRTLIAAALGVGCNARETLPQKDADGSGRL